MSALTGPRAATVKTDVNAIANSMAYPVLANAVIYAGAMVALDSSGYAKPAVAATGLVIAGRAERTVDATGKASGALYVPVSQGVFAWDIGTAGDALTIADRGKVVFASDDHTVNATDNSGARSPAGILADVAGGQAFVEMRGTLAASMLDVQGSALLAANQTFTGNDTFSGDVSLGGAAKTVGFYGSAGGVKASAYTQTYATADKTVPAATSHAITDSSGGTPSTTALAAQAVTVTGVDGTGSNAASKADVDTVLGVLRDNISTLAAELALVKADLLAAKKNTNALIDDLQAVNLV